MKRTIWLSAMALILVGFIGMGFLAPGFIEETSEPQKEIEWISMEEAVKRSEQDGKKIIVDMYTNWCGWCKKMDRDTYAKQEVVSIINENYHAVKFNAEQKGDVTIKGRTYKFDPAVGRRGAHRMAIEMLNGKMSYPTTVFLNNDLSILTSVPGYQNAKGMMPILSYLAKDEWKKTPWEKYQSDYSSR